MKQNIFQINNILINLLVLQKIPWNFIRILQICQVRNEDISPLCKVRVKRIWCIKHILLVYKFLKQNGSVLIAVKTFVLIVLSALAPSCINHSSQIIVSCQRQIFTTKLYKMVPMIFLRTKIWSVLPDEIFALSLCMCYRFCSFLNSFYLHIYLFIICSSIRLSFC